MTSYTISPGDFPNHYKRMSNDIERLKKKRCEEWLKVKSEKSKEFLEKGLLNKIQDVSGDWQKDFVFRK